MDLPSRTGSLKLDPSQLRGTSGVEIDTKRVPLGSRSDREKLNDELRYILSVLGLGDHCVENI